MQMVRHPKISTQLIQTAALIPEARSSMWNIFENRHGLRYAWLWQMEYAYYLQPNSISSCKSLSQPSNTVVKFQIDCIYIV